MKVYVRLFESLFCQWHTDFQQLATSKAIALPLMSRKQRGVSAVDSCLRERELEVALLEAKSDIDAGRYSNDGVADHMIRVIAGL